MNALLDLTERPGWLGAGAAGLAAAALAAAYYFEHVVGLAPCTLCLYQRIPWWIVLGLGSLAILGRRMPVLATTALGLAALALLGNAGLAGYHVGVEQGWWAGPAGCSADALPQSLGALNQALAGPPAPRCDEASWTLFGLSMPAYNMLLSLGGALAVAWAMRRAGDRAALRRV